MIKSYIASIHKMREFFDRSTRCLDEKDSDFTPRSEMLTVASHVAHVAQTVEWFLDGAFNPNGMAMNFEEMHVVVQNVHSLSEARAWFKRACDRAETTIGSKAAAEMEVKITGALMGGQPRSYILEGMTDHAAHHRGALTVYARLLGKVPPMPYMEL